MFEDDMIENLFKNMDLKSMKKMLKLLELGDNALVKFNSSKPVNDLTSFINGYDKKSLILIANAYNIEFEKYNRTKLIKEIIEKYNKGEFAVLFNLLDKTDIKEIDNLIKKNNVDKNGGILIEFKILFEKQNDKTLKNLLDLGLCSLYTDSEFSKQEYYIPKEIIDVYKNTKINLADGKKIIEYLGKIICLIGVCKLDKIYEMLKKYIKKNISYEDFLIYIFGYIRIEFDSYIYEDYLVYDILKKEDVDKYIKIQEKNKIFALPIFTQNIIDIYVKERLVASPIMLEILNHFSLDEDIELYNEISEYLRSNLDSTDQSVNKVVNIISSKINKKTDINDSNILKLIKLAIMDTRMYKYGGFKEVEINDEMYGLIEDGNFKPLNSKYSNFKIGRNEPCPCRSGYKYKKCCGK